jgi:hypothetical protein
MKKTLKDSDEFNEEKYNFKKENIEEILQSFLNLKEKFLNKLKKILSS